MKFRKKPVEVEAWPISELMHDHRHMRMLPSPIAQGIIGNVLLFKREGIYIQTLEGGMFGRPDDILIMGVAGEFYPCRPDIFAATYDRVKP